MGTPKSRARGLRGALVGASSAVLTVGAHAAAGGGIPNGGALIMSLLACAVVGATVGCLTLEGRGARWLATTAALSAAQLSGHVILVAAGHQHAGSALGLSPSMAATHIGAAVILGLAITAAEYLYVVCTSVLSWLRLFTAATRAPASQALRAFTSDIVAQSVLRCSGLGMRAPPLGHAIA